jgi:hypothetical protein
MKRLLSLILGLVIGLAPVQSHALRKQTAYQIALSIGAVTGLATGSAASHFGAQTGKSAFSGFISSAPAGMLAYHYLYQLTPEGRCDHAESLLKQAEKFPLALTSCPSFEAMVKTMGDGDFFKNNQTRYIAQIIDLKDLGIALHEAGVALNKSATEVKDDAQATALQTRIAQLHKQCKEIIEHLKHNINLIEQNDLYWKQKKSSAQDKQADAQQEMASAQKSQTRLAWVRTIYKLWPVIAAGGVAAAGWYGIRHFGA